MEGPYVVGVAQDGNVAAALIADDVLHLACRQCRRCGSFAIDSVECRTLHKGTIYDGVDVFTQHNGFQGRTIGEDCVRQFPAVVGDHFQAFTAVKAA